MPEGLEPSRVLRKAAFAPVPANDVAKTLNRLFVRGGQVWSDRCHSHVLKTRREVANALRYVLGNFARHARQWGESVRNFADDCSSLRFLGLTGADAPVAAPRTWLLRIGWQGGPSGRSLSNGTAFESLARIRNHSMKRNAFPHSARRTVRG